MTEQREGVRETTQGKTDDPGEERAGGEAEELEAEQESAAAMDADVPHQTTEDQSS